jgi:hypothetical protein
VKLIVTNCVTNCWARNVMGHDASVRLDMGVICFITAVEQCAWAKHLHVYHVVCTEGTGWIFELDCDDVL